MSGAPDGFRLPNRGGPFPEELAYRNGDGWTETRITVHDLDGFNRWKVTLPAARALARILRARVEELQAQELQEPHVGLAHVERRELALELHRLDESIAIHDRAEAAHDARTKEARRVITALRNDGAIFTFGRDRRDRVRATLPWDR